MVDWLSGGDAAEPVKVVLGFAGGREGKHKHKQVHTLIIQTLKARPFPASLEGLALSCFDLMGGLLLRLFLALPLPLPLPLLTEIVAEEEEEDREEGLSRVGMMRTMTEEKALARPAVDSWSSQSQ